MWDTFMGEVRYFGCNFAPVGWASCDGALLPIAEHEALFSLIGTRYGGDGRTTFALPDLRGSVAIHQGTGVDLPARGMGSASALHSAPDPHDGNRTIGALVLNPCIAVEGIYPSQW
jgi:microcystin-dependent protein